MICLKFINIDNLVEQMPQPLLPDTLYASFRSAEQAYPRVVMLDEIRWPSFR